MLVGVMLDYVYLLKGENSSVTRFCKRPPDIDICQCVNVLFCNKNISCTDITVKKFAVTAMK